MMLVVLAGWAHHLSTVSLTCPHFGFVAWALLYLAVSPSSRDRSDSATETRSTHPHSQCAHIESIAIGVRHGGPFLLLLRAILSCGYLCSGLGKVLYTPVWSNGRAFEVLARGYLRHAVAPSLASFLSLASPLLTAITLLIELGLPVVDVLLWWSTQWLPCIDGTGAGQWGRVMLLSRLLVLCWLASGGMQVGILILMPMEDVPAGMLRILAETDPNLRGLVAFVPECPGVDLCPACL